MKLRVGFDDISLFSAATVLALLGVSSAVFARLEAPGKGTLALVCLLLVACWLRGHRRRVPAASRLNLHPDGNLLLSLGDRFTWRGRLEPQSWSSQHLVLLRVRLPFGFLWLPVLRHRQMIHQFRRLRVGLRHNRWGPPRPERP